MGCISSKESTSNESSLRKGSLDRRVAHVNSSRRDDVVRSKDRLALIDKKNNGPFIPEDDQTSKRKVENLIEKKSVKKFDNVSVSLPNIDQTKIKKIEKPVSSNLLPNSLEGELVAAGWPSWLSSAAGEAIKGWTPRRASNFEKLDRIGQGTYSYVYRARDLTRNKIVALKKVRFDNKDCESVKFMAREIMILRQLDHPNIIKLEGLITSNNSSSLYLVFEYMEHDLTGLASLPGIKFTESQIKCYMRQLLSGLDHCHKRNILHRDIKGSNLLIDNNGILKIADFGLASFFDPRSSAPLTSRVVTLWYRAPELLLGASKYGVAVDLWSTGCILGELYSAKPILPGRTEVEQLHKIFKLCGSPNDDYWRTSKLPQSSVIKPQRPYKRCIAETFKECSPTAVSLLETLLSMEPQIRGTAASALTSEYFTTFPYACDPSALPMYPPSKEMDAKLRDEEMKRKIYRQSQQAISETNGNKPDELVSNSVITASSIQRNRPSHSSARLQTSVSRNELAASLNLEPSKQALLAKEGRRETGDQSRRKVSHSGPLVQGSGRPKPGKDPGDTQSFTGNGNLQAVSGSATSRPLYSEDAPAKYAVTQFELSKQLGKTPSLLSGSKPSTKLDHLHKISDSPLSRDSKPAIRDPIIYGPRGNKIYVSGPLLVSSNNVEHLVKEHDRQFQELDRRRIDKVKLEKTLNKIT